jgi:trehalose synthase
MADGDTRWIHRGSYDLMDRNPESTRSTHGIPKARSLYGSLASQLEQPDSFAMRMKQLLAIRQAYGIASSRQVAVPVVSTPGLLVMVHELPDARGMQVTALNFGAVPVDERVFLSELGNGIVIDMINEAVIGDLTEDTGLHLLLEPYEGASLRVVSSQRPAL